MLICALFFIVCVAVAVGVSISEREIDYEKNLGNNPTSRATTFNALTSRTSKVAHGPEVVLRRSSLTLTYDAGSGVVSKALPNETRA